MGHVDLYGRWVGFVRTDGKAAFAIRAFVFGRKETHRSTSCILGSPACIHLYLVYPCILYIDKFICGFCWRRSHLGHKLFA